MNNANESASETKAKVKVTIEVEVDESWIEYVTKYNDIFMHNYCGYWLYGVDCDEDLGWLCYVDPENPGSSPDSDEAEMVTKAWKAGAAFPDNLCGKYYLLDRKAAIESFKQGVLWHGTDWYENGDAEAYDHVIQMALLGELVYG